ncbi:SLATT domain-containing protein [Pseudidiomarina marina]|uniref:SMODS and SLOG-associating 2TM effector domain-containing protein n=1 Tax=Pseudidiomarina marina TaxID=502366 RepID=A0A432YE69_9GAMM|nr:SLATT domain-containing protein [Pseudidiomarina marina]RUO59212.1 hypothetical protein CWI76_09265 [Pseudidiomarina marina]
MQKKKPFEELHDRIQKTANNRFNAHNRLKLHHSLSLWTITLLSIGLILVPLLETFDLDSGLRSGYSAFVQTFFAIVILVISIILNMTNFSVRAERFHQCGLILNALARRVHQKIDENAGGIEYEKYVQDYDNALQRFDNHSRIDYLYTKSHMTNYYKNPWWFYGYTRIRRFSEYVFYLLIIIFEGILIWPLVAL